MNVSSLSRGLGWFSIGLGAAELFAPRRLARAVGVGEENETLIRLLGARELASGLGILARPKPTGFMWSRVAGDIMDIGLLGTALAHHDSQPAAFRAYRDQQRQRLIGAIAAVAGVTILDVFASVALSRPPHIDPRWRYTPPGGRAGIRQPETLHSSASARPADRPVTPPPAPRLASSS